MCSEEGEIRWRGEQGLWAIRSTGMMTAGVWR
nr:hypothetical protein [Pectobacterium aroidearum]